MFYWSDKIVFSECDFFSPLVIYFFMNLNKFNYNKTTLSINSNLDEREWLSSF